MDQPRPRLLYIDDDAGLCRLVQKDLERNGYAVECAANGTLGLARLTAGGIDVVALDHHMPGHTGLETLAVIATLPNPPPVIYVTGEAESRVAVAALKAGAVDYVAKEVNGEFLLLLRAAVVGAIAARRSEQARERAESELRASRDRFEALAHEREILLQEVNHRVANSLQLVNVFLRMQWSAVAGADAKAAFANAIARVGAIGHVHRQLYASDNVQAVDLGRYLDNLIADLSQALGPDGSGVRLKVEIEPATMTTDRALTIGIIVTELVLNALKHAYPEGQNGEVRVSCRRHPEGGVVLAVADDGHGMVAKPQAGRGGSGQRIIQMMASKLRGSLEHDQAHRGTRIVIRIPEEITAPEAVSG